MKVRLAVPADYERLIELWNRAATFDPLSLPLFAEKVRDDADATTLLVESDGELQGFVTFVARQLADEIRGIVKLVAVAPDSQRQGIGTLLLREAEAGLASRGATSVRVGESFPNYLTPGVDLRYAPATSFFMSQGYEPFADAVNLEVDLHQWQSGRKQPSPLPQGIDIRRATGAETDSIAQLIRAHWPPWWGEVSQALANNPPTLFVAVAGERVVGFAAHDANNRGTGSFGPMGTDPAAQGQGIGRQLLDATLEDMRQQGCARAIIPWVGPVEFYTRHAGAKVSRRFQRFRKSLTPGSP